MPYKSLSKAFYKTFLGVILSLFSLFSIQAKITEPVEWTVSTEKISDTEYDLFFKVSLQGKFHIYSQFLKDDLVGPIPTQFIFTDGAYERIGRVEEPEGHEEFDKTWEENIKFFEKEAIFKQRIKLKSGFQSPLKVSVISMACDDTRCLPPEEKAFEFDLDRLTAASEKLTVSTNDEVLSQSVILPIKLAEGVKLSITEKKSLWNLFVLGFIGGLIALLTPCVFPMIPLTVSFFSHSAGGRAQGVFKAIMYGVFILVIYILVSVPFHLLDTVSPDSLNNISTNTWLNVLFFVVFVIFAISFFGFFEITLPSSWSNAMDAKASKVGGIVGVFFMALTLTLVSFSCTGPILGSLLGGSLSNDGGAIQLTYGLAGFGLALALPFAFFALFPSLLKKLPKSGGWMSTVKAVLGFAELAFALKFLSNADLVEHWGLLKREVFIGIWVLIALALAVYLFGFYKMPHDAPNQKISWVRKILGGISLVFALSLIPGMLPASSPYHSSLKWLSGFPPPTFYSIYENATPEGHLKAYNTLEEGIEASKKEGKPILLDFTGWACVNCRKMEEQVWVDPEVNKVIDDEVILVSLYVDDNKALPEAQQFNVKYPNKKIIKKVKTIGDKWASLQSINFKNNSQPYYVMMDANYTVLSTPVGYTSDANMFYKWLKKGIKNK